MADATRQYGKTLADIRQDHVNRYRFAATIADATVLDAACGCGYGSHILKEAGCDVIGIDIEQDAIDFARTYYSGPSYECADILSAELPQVDCVVSFETLEHLHHPEDVLEKFRDVGQLLIASVPNEHFYPYDPLKFIGDKYPHRRHYSPEEFEELLRSCGWNALGKWCQKTRQAEVTTGTDGLFLVYVCR